MYAGADYDEAREVIITKLCVAAPSVIQLPKDLIINFAWLGNTVHGTTAVQHRFKNRISINNMLTLEQIPAVLIHELIHVEQIHIKRLRVAHGIYYWDGTPHSLKNTLYENLPWEADVVEKQQQILIDILAIAMING